MAHGANQTLEDVAALVESLDAAPGPAAAVRMYSARRRRRAAAASAVATRSLVVSGPRTLLQGERVLGLAGLLPSRASGRAATWGFGRLLSGLSARI
jgi:FAD-dependent urate hydroxylase